MIGESGTEVIALDQNWSRGSAAKHTSRALSWVINKKYPSICPVASRYRHVACKYGCHAAIETNVVVQ